LSESFFEALKRRNVFKVATAYLVLAWIVVQITALAVPALHLPLWINSLVFFLALLGLPIALFFAWAFEMTPQGIKRQSEDVSEALAKSPTSVKLNVVLVSILIIVAAYFIYESRFSESDAEATKAVVSESSGEVTQADAAVLGASIAVLPFVNMSSDSEQEYFSDGISEEILNVLAQVPKLHVTSRSSAFAFKGKDINLAEVATTLGVENILEGSVRKSGDKIRITAQLIKASDDKHLWSATYDRELLDIFAVQDEISSAIVMALKEKLGLNAQIPSRETHHINLDAHNEYLKGRYFLARRTHTDIEAALAHFIKATELAPLYAQAWTNVAITQFLSSEENYGKTPEFIAYEQANISVDKALLIDSELSSASAVKGMINSKIDGSTAHTFLTKAITLDGSNAEAHAWLGSLLSRNGQYQQGLLAYEKAVKLDPFSLVSNGRYANMLASFGDFNQAQQQIANMVALKPNAPSTYYSLADIRVMQNRRGEAAWLHQKALQLTQGKGGGSSAYFFTLAMMDLNLGETAAAMLTTTPYGFFAPLALHQLDQYAATIRTIFPRDDKDMLGFAAIGLAENLVGEYASAVSWFDKTTYLQGEYSYEIYSYLEERENTIGKKYLNKALAQLAHGQEIGLTAYGLPVKSILMVAAELSYLQGDIDKTIHVLESAIDGGAVLLAEYRYYPMYDALRAHPKWPALLKKSELTVGKQQVIYRQLRDQDASIADVLAVSM
jgi:TolB-like protein